MYFYRRDLSWIASGARGGGAIAGRFPAPLLADAGTPSPPADDLHSRWWCTRNIAKRLVRESTGEHDWGSTVAIGPRTMGRGIATPPPHCMLLDNQSTSRAGWAHKTEGSGQVSGAVAHVSKHMLEKWRGVTIANRPPGMGNPQARRRTQLVDRPTSQVVSTFDVCSNLALNSDLSWPHLHCGPMQWRNYGYQHPAPETSAPYHLDTPLTFVSRRPFIWYAGHSHGEANKRSTDSKHRATGDKYPAHDRPVVRRSLVSILRSPEIPFPGSRKSETRYSPVLLTSLALL